MVLENLCVLHKTFGNGIITAVNGKYMTVAFANAQKTFVYPDAFEKFLTCMDGSVPAEILDDIADSKRKKQAIEDARVAENRHAMDHGIVIPGKEAVQDTKEEDGSQITVEDI